LLLIGGTAEVPHHQLTTINFIVRDDAITTTYHECRHPCHVIWWKPKRSFLPRKWRRL